MEILSFMEIVGTIAFAITGALTAIKKDLDYYGICFLAVITAVGGGIIRDLIIDRDLPVSVDNPVYVIISLVTALVVILFYKKSCVWRVLLLGVMPWDWQHLQLLELMLQ